MFPLQCIAALRISLVKDHKTENPQQVNLTKTCGQAKLLATGRYVNYPIAMHWCQLQLFWVLIEIQMYKSDGLGMGAVDQEAINCMHPCTFSESADKVFG